MALTRDLIKTRYGAGQIQFVASLIQDKFPITAEFVDNIVGLRKSIQARNYTSHFNLFLESWAVYRKFNVEKALILKHHNSLFWGSRVKWRVLARDNTHSKNFSMENYVVVNLCQHITMAEA